MNWWDNEPWELKHTKGLFEVYRGGQNKDLLKIFYDAKFLCADYLNDGKIIGGAIKSLDNVLAVRHGRNGDIFSLYGISTVKPNQMSPIIVRPRIIDGTHHGFGLGRNKLGIVTVNVKFGVRNDVWIKFCFNSREWSQSDRFNDGQPELPCVHIIPKESLRTAPPPRSQGPSRNTKPGELEP